ncbi:MAG TPA: hemerythrin domain-containing protein [Dissulfurispiraceae bacterium]
MDILAFLKKDHENALLLFDELDEAAEKSGKKQSKQDQVFNQLRNELEIHMLGEEEVFYPVLNEDADISPMIMEGIEEHRVIKMILAEMVNMPKDEKWTAKLRVLRENVEHHIEEEEDDVFENAEGILDKEQRNEIGNRMAEVKERHMATMAR